jgi:hypothetical protein
MTVLNNQISEKKYIYILFLISLKILRSLMHILYALIFEYKILT